MVSLPVLKMVPNSNDWIGFWGSYIGTILGVSTPLYILYKQRNEDRKQSVLPVISAMHLDGIVNKREVHFQMDYLFNDEDESLEPWLLNDKMHSNTRERTNDRSGWLHTAIIVKNIGKGPVINLSVHIFGKKRGISQYKISIAENEAIRYSIRIPREYLEMLPEQSKKRNKIIFTYEDAYGNKYFAFLEFSAIYSEQRGIIVTNYGNISNMYEGEYEELKAIE